MSAQLMTEAAPVLPCGHNVNEQVFCNTLLIPHQLLCECGTLYECEAADDGVLVRKADPATQCSALRHGIAS